MSTYSPHQQRIIREILRQTQGDPRRIRRATLMAGLVESNLRHIRYGDRDSQGFLQQRPSQGWGPYRPGMRGVRTDLRQFLDRARAATQQGFQGGPGALAQTVQGSAFPERYGQRRAEVKAILRGFGGGGSAAPAMGAAGTPAAAPMAAGGNPLAMALLERIGGGKDKPSIMELVQAAQQQQAAVAPRQPPQPQGGQADLKPGGGWGGSKGIADGLVQGLGLPITSTKRDTRNTSSGNPSDHWVGSKDAFAYDLGGNERQMDRAARRVLRRIGRGDLARSWDGESSLVVTTNIRGYRVQLIYDSPAYGGHEDHLHLGVRRL